MRLFWIPVMFLMIGCTSPQSPEEPPNSSGWDGKVQQWGTLREVMHGEVMDGQVRLSEAIDKPHVYGIGAPDKLHGEILIADSVAWVAEVKSAEEIKVRQGDTSDSAVLLAIAQVPRWTEVIVDNDVTAEEFDDFIQKTLSEAGLDELETVPFVIEGRFSSLDLHVLNGQCPFAEIEVEIEGAGPPLHTKLSEVRGVLVGFFAEQGAGRITHHWTRTHIHALVGPEDERVVGHVDAAAMKSGTVIRVPTLDSEPD